ncbi:class I SAM-dependent methyltransferase [Halosegnis sp.]|uniref:class I SAM-dependent methyltransferase n=1 Tax=Halosegnis sp. TaxID=2864959 RepID=UPI0035D5023E
MNLLGAAIENPWATLQRLLDGPLHPGGREATGRLLDRAGVDPGTQLLDVGCGAGDAVNLARERGAAAVGLDADPTSAPTDAVVRGDLGRLPVRTESVDVVLAECVLCLAADLDGALAEAKRVLVPGGRLALSDIVVRGTPPNLPDALAEPLCLTGDRHPDQLVESVEQAGLSIVDSRDHPEDLLAMRDRVRSRVDYERLLGAMGERGQRMLEGIERLEAAVESEQVGYISVVAER